MGDYSVSNFSFNKGKVEYNREKKKTFDLTKFDGVSKDELIQRAGGTETQQGKLIASIFGKYDGPNGDGILTTEEYQLMQADLVRIAHDGNVGGKELGKFNEHIGADKNAYSMEDLQAVIGMMVDGSDSVTGVVQDGDNLKVTYKPIDGVGTKTSTFSKGDNNALTLLSDSVVNGDTTTVTEYIGGDKNKKSKITETTGDTVTTTVYADNGTDIQSKTRIRGTVTEELDPANGDRIIRKTTNKGSGGIEIIEYTYNSDGSVTETTHSGDKNKPSKVVVKDAQDNVVSTKTYTYTNDGQSTELEVTGTGDNAQTVRTVRDSNNKITEHTNVVAGENGSYTVQDATHEVKPGETWYNIVQAKYGVTDHKTIMQIVHKLKDNAGVRYSSASMPPKLTLPGTIDLGGGNIVNLKNTGALVSIDGVKDPNGRQIGPRITPPQALAKADIPQPIDALTSEQQHITIPTFEVKQEKAGQYVRQDNGQYYYYNEDGRVTHIYENENAKNADNNSVYIKYDNQGAVTTYQQNTYDAQGHLTGSIQYDGTGAFTKRWVNDQFNPEHPEQYRRQTYYNANGSIDQILVKSEYSKNWDVDYDNFKADGSWWCSRRLDYGNDGACQVRYYDASDRGRMTKIEK